jgi:hypothetical protein
MNFRSILFVQWDSSRDYNPSSRAAFWKKELGELLQAAPKIVP